MEKYQRSFGANTVKSHGILRIHAGKLHRKPLNLKKNNGDDSRTLQIVSEDSQKQQVNFETYAFTKEQLSQLYKLFKFPQFSVTLSCSFAQNGNLFTVALSCETSNPYCSWIIDFKATYYMTSHHNYSHFIVHVQEIKRSRLLMDHYP